MPTRALGLSFSGHGSAICLVEDGHVVRALNLERTTRVKHGVAVPRIPELEPPDFVPAEHAGAVFDQFEVLPGMLEYVAGDADPRRAGIDVVVRVRDGSHPRLDPLWSEATRRLGVFFAGIRADFDVEHHLLHAYQAYLASPFADTAILTVDGQGDHLARHGGKSVTTSLAVGEGNRVRVLSEVVMPSSIGGVYGLATRHLGFGLEQEGNTMALASFGTDRLYREMREGLVLHDDGTFELLQTAPGHSWDELTRLDVVARVERLGPPRDRSAPFTRDHEDLAFAVQALTEDIVVNAARGLQARTGKQRLAMAGGVALNCVANARILRDTPFEELHVVPNAGDRGLALGAALYGYHVLLDRAERHPPKHDYLGRPYSDTEVLSALRAAPEVVFRRSDDVAREAAELVAGGRIIGWFQGGAEFGPRALGHRSLLADPRTPASKERLDREIKRREWFRPYAPSVLSEHADEYFEMRGPSPYMLQAVRARPLAKERAPGIVHVDGTARVQTVTAAEAPLYHRLISRFHELTGVPLVLNTSFNGYGEPIVERPEEAVAAMTAMGLDALCIGEYVVVRRDRS